MHWYISMMYVLPVVGVGGWGWWSSKRMTKRKQEKAAAKRATTPQPGVGSAATS